MKEYFIEQLSNMVDEEISTTFLLQEINTTINRFSNKWQDAILKDKTGTIPMRIWNENMMDDYEQYVGKVVTVLGRVTLYMDRPMIEAIQIQSCDAVVDMTDYYDGLEPDEIEAFKKQLLDAVSNITDAKLLTLVKNVFTEKMMEKLANYPLNESYGAYPGALLAYISNVTSIVADNIRNRELSFYEQEIDASVAIAGAALCEIGKIYEFEPFPSMKRNNRGWLVPTSIDSILYINYVLNSLKKEEKIENCSSLFHIICTTSADQDAMEKPRTLEAILVQNVKQQVEALDKASYSFYRDSRRTMENRKYVYSKSLHRTLIRPKEGR